MSTPYSMAIFVNDKDVLAMFNHVIYMVSPPALQAFLDGPVDSYFKEQVENRFTNEGDAASGAWAPLSEATQAIRTGLGYGAAHPINVRTGELKSLAMSDGNSRMEPWGASLEMPGTAPQGELAEKMYAAQHGGVGPSGSPFPRRPVVAMNEADTVAVTFMLHSHVTSSVV